MVLLAGCFVEQCSFVEVVVVNKEMEGDCQKDGPITGARCRSQGGEMDGDE